MAKLTIASLNILGLSLNPFDLALRYQTIARYFNNSDVDVIHFQEVLSYFHLKILKKAFKKYPFCIYDPACIGPRGGLVIFSKFALLNTNYTKFSAKFMPVASIPELILQKGVLYGELERSGITLINTHFTAVLDHIWSFQGKYYQKIASEIATFQNVIKKNYHRKIIISSGDFNIEKDSDLYKRLINLKNLYDPFNGNSQGTCHREFMSDNRKPDCIDHIFIIGDKNNYQVNQKKFIFSGKVKLLNKKSGYISDHLGLQLTIQLV